MTEGVDQVYGVNHNQIESIAHRTVRYLKVAAGGTMRAQPVMLGEVKSEEDAASIRRIVHNALKDDPGVETHSVEVEGTNKKAILLRPKH